MQRTSKIALNSGFILAEACGLQDDVILLCLASSTTPRRRNLLVALAQYTVRHFLSSSTKSSSWFLSSLLTSEYRLLNEGNQRHSNSSRY